MVVNPRQLLFASEVEAELLVDASALDADFHGSGTLRPALPALLSASRMDWTVPSMWSGAPPIGRLPCQFTLTKRQMSVYTDT
jgi:hypothetical protein